MHRGMDLHAGMLEAALEDTARDQRRKSFLTSMMLGDISERAALEKARVPEEPDQRGRRRTAARKQTKQDAEALEERTWDPGARTIISDGLKPRDQRAWSSRDMEAALFGDAAVAEESFQLSGAATDSMKREPRYQVRFTGGSEEDEYLFEASKMFFQKDFGEIMCSIYMASYPSIPLLLYLLLDD